MAVFCNDFEFFVAILIFFGRIKQAIFYISNFYLKTAIFRYFV